MEKIPDVYFYNTDKNQYINNMISTIQPPIYDKSFLNKKKALKIKKHVQSYTINESDLKSPIVNDNKEMQKLNISSESHDLTNITNLNNLTGLTSLTNITGLTDLTNITNITSLTSLNNLTSLNGLTNITSLNNLTDLNNLTGLNNLTNITSLTSLTSLTESDDTKYFSFEELIINLKLLSQLKKDEKLISDKGNLDIDNRYAQSFRRWITGDGRDTTYDMLKKINKSANFHSENYINLLKEKNNEDVRHNLEVLTRDLISSRTGFRNLLITYRDDESFLSKLDLCFDTLIVRINKNLSFE